MDLIHLKMKINLILISQLILELLIQILNRTPLQKKNLKKPQMKNLIWNKKFNKIQKKMKKRKKLKKMNKKKITTIATISLFILLLLHS